MTKLDRKKMSATLQKSFKRISEHFWKNGVAFYLDSTNFVKKMNQQDQPMALEARIC